MWPTLCKPKAARSTALRSSSTSRSRPCLHEVKIRLHAEVTVTVTINIARSQDEAERQARGENVVTSQYDEDRAAAEEAAADMLEGGAGSYEVDFGADR